MATELCIKNGMQRSHAIRIILCVEIWFHRAIFGLNTCVSLLRSVHVCVSFNYHSLVSMSRSVYFCFSPFFFFCSFYRLSAYSFLFWGSFVWARTCICVCVMYELCVYFTFYLLFARVFQCERMNGTDEQWRHDDAAISTSEITENKFFDKIIGCFITLPFHIFLCTFFSLSLQFFSLVNISFGCDRIHMKINFHATSSIHRSGGKIETLSNDFLP